jgi:ABC-type glycerol-3-phosphate transport system substrate-binding protein
MGSKNQAQITKTNSSVDACGVGRPWGESIAFFEQRMFLFPCSRFGVKLFNDVKDHATFSLQQGVIQATSKPFFPFTEALSLFSSFGNPAYKNYSWNKDITSLAADAKELNPFLRGKVAMIFGYSHLYQDLSFMRQELKSIGETVVNEDDIGIAEFPQLLSFAESGKRSALASYFPLTVSRNSKNPGYAWDFIQYLSTKESMLDYHAKTHKPSSRKDLVDEQMVEPMYGVFARQASYAKSLFAGSPVDADFLNTVFAKALDEASQNKKTLEEITNQAQAAVNCQIEKQAKLGEVEVNCLNLAHR